MTPLNTQPAQPGFLTPHMLKTNHGAQLRQRIDKLAKTKNGFTRSDGKDVVVCASMITKYCSRLAMARKLFRATVAGHTVHYFSTQAAADHWAATTKPKVKAKDRPKVYSKSHLAELERKKQLLALIDEKSATPGGFLVADAIGIVSKGAAYKAGERLVREGKLFRTNIGGKKSWYFSTQAAADAFRLPAKVKTPKTPKPVAQIVRTGYTPPPPKKPVHIIYPEGYKHSYHPMLAPRNQAHGVAFVHSGMRAMHG